MSMADSAGTDTHRMCTCTCLTFSVAPSIPYPLFPLPPPRTLPMPRLPSPSFLRMHILAETANEDSSFLWHLSIQVRLDLGRREIRPSPVTSLTLFLILLHFRLLPLILSLSSIRVPRKPPSILSYGSRFESWSSFYTVRPLRMNLTDDSWYETVTSGRQTAGCRLFVSFFFFAIFLPLSLCQPFIIWFSLNFALFDFNPCSTPSSPQGRFIVFPTSFIVFPT